MRPTITVTNKGKDFAFIKAQLKALEKAQVLVGVPEDKNARKDEMTNASLVYLHTHGSALNHIPARPIIEPAIQAPDNRALITKQLAKAAADVLAEKPDAANQALQRAGMLGRNAIIRWFTDPRNHWAGLAPSTIRRKGSSRPLIDTAQMRRAMSYVVNAALRLRAK